MFDIEAVRVKVKLAAPYFTSIIYRMRPIFKPGIGTVAVDANWNWYIDPDVDWTLDEQVMATIHEIHHITLNHHTRAQGRDGRTWNTAGDMEINDGLQQGITIKETGDFMELPEGCVYPSTYGFEDGRLAEEYYSRIKKQQEEEKGCLPQPTDEDTEETEPNDEGDEGLDSEPSDGDDEDGKDGDESDDGDSDGDSNDGDDDGDDEGDSPSGTDGVPGDGGMPGKPEAKCGGIVGNPNDFEDEPEDDENKQDMSDVEQESIVQKVAEDIVSSGIGKVPGYLQEWAEKQLDTTVPWDKVLKAAIRNAVQVVSGGDTDYTWRKENPRHDLSDIILPSMISYSPDVAVGIDTSGSVIGMVPKFMAEVRGILRSHAQELYVAWGDTIVQGSARVGTAGKAKLIIPRGGGGTDMRVIIKHLEEARPKPNIIIILTDSETPWPIEPVKAKLIIVTTAEDGDYWWNKHPSFAKAVHMEGDE